MVIWPARRWRLDLSDERLKLSQSHTLSSILNTPQDQLSSPDLFPYSSCFAFSFRIRSQIVVFTVIVMINPASLHDKHKRDCYINGCKSAALTIHVCKHVYITLPVRMSSRPLLTIDNEEKWPSEHPT